MLQFYRSFFILCCLTLILPLGWANGSVLECTGALQAPPFVKLSLSEYAYIIAEPPVNPMGEDFAQSFGQFLRENQARPNNFQELSQKLFRNRLDLAKRHQTKFVGQMSDGAWMRRLLGVSDGRAWSFGIRNHSRGKAVHEFFTQVNLSDYSSNEEWVDLDVFSRNIGQGISLIPVIHFTFPVDKKVIDDFKIYLVDADTFFIEHAKDTNVPVLMKIMDSLWQSFFDRSKSLEKRIEILAHWEWLWFWTNPFGRAGASIGDGLSLLLQEQLISEGYALKLRGGYHHQDLEALSRSRADYTAHRFGQLLMKGNQDNDLSRKL